MVVRHKSNRGWKLVAAFLAGSLASTFSSGKISAQEASKFELPFTKRSTLGTTGKAHASLTGAIEAQRKGDYDAAAKLFREAQVLQSDLTPTERTELSRLMSANQDALRQRKEAEASLAAVQQLVDKGQVNSASDLLRRLEANEQYFSAASKQKFATLQEKVHSGRTTARAADRGSDSASKARALIAEGRSLTMDGKFEAAEQKIREAESLRVTFSASEDTPSKLRDDIQKSRNDARFLLTAGHQALAANDLELAEKLAKAADRAAGPLTFRFALDNPTRLLKDILEAKATRTASATPAGTSRAATPNSVSGIVQASASDLGFANPEAEAHCRSLVKESRAAMQKGDMTSARQIAEKARATRANLPWWEDTPERVLAEIQKSDAAKNAMNVADAGKLSPEQQLKAARLLFSKGELDQATEMVMKLKANTTARWGLFDDNPDRLRGEIEKALNKRNQDESVKVLIEARKLYDGGDYEKATRAAYRAQQLHGPYSIWELGDRPQKLIAEIESARLRKKVTNKLDTAITQTATRAENKANLAANRADQSIKKNLEKTQDTVKKATDTTDRAISQVAGAAQAVGSKVDDAVSKAEGTVSGLVGIPPLPGAKEHADTSVPALLDEARALQAKGRLVEARAKVIQAQRMGGGSLPPGVATPEEVLSDLNRMAAKQVALSLATVNDIASKGGADSFQLARMEVDRARLLAKEFGLDQSTVDAKAKWLASAAQPAKESTTKDSFVGGIPPLPTPQSALPPLPGAPTGLPPLPGGFPDSKELTPPLPVGTPGDSTNPGKALLDKARAELRAGQGTNARRLAEEAHQGPYGVKDEASALLRTIDTEDGNQRGLEAKRTFDAGVAAYNRKEYSQALAIFTTVQDKFLDKERASRKKELLQSPALQGLVRSDLEKPGMGGSGPIARVKPGTDIPGLPGADNSPAGAAPKTDLVEAAQAIKEVKFSQLRQQGLDAQREAAEKFRAGQTDAALEILQDHLSQLNDAQLDATKLALLKRPVESRLQHFKLLKAQKEFLEKDNVVRDTKRNSISQKQLAEENKQKKVSEQMKLFNQAFKEAKYLEAESFAMRAHELDPDNSMAAAAVSMAKMQRNVSVAKGAKNEREKFFFEGMTDAESMGTMLTVNKPLDGGAEGAAERRNRRNSSLTTLATPRRTTAADREIESRLNTPVNINFKDITLREALEDLRKYYNINIVPDVAALEEEGVSLERPVTLMLEQVSLKSALNLMLRSAHLTYVIKDEVLLITTESQARGKLQTVTYQVTDLITPLENFGSLKAGQPLTNRGATRQTMAGGNNPGISGGNPTPIQAPYSLSGGTGVGSPSGGGLQGDSPNVTVSKRGGQTTEDTLIKLITATINPQSWNTVGGPGSIEFFPLTNSLVINQTPDIQEQVQDLLNNLRRLLDQEVAIEIRFISIAEDFYERIGVNFNMNIKTDRNTSRFEPQIVSNSYKPAGYINDPNMHGLIGGLTPAGTFTTDLDIPVNNTSFGLTNPVFGGYPGLPGSGGISLGLAFLSDIQVFLFMEAAQGDNRTNVMQAPKITMFNGQTSALGVFDSQFFLTDVAVTPLANGNITFTPVVTEQPIGFQMSLQAIISADRRVVRLTPSIQLTNLVPGPVQLFPIVVPIFPQTGNLVNPNPSDPITFTQFIQQPIINTLFVQTTVAVPDGGTVLMGGFKRLSESRSEYGPPVLSKIPYINRLFRNTGYGRETQSMLMMVTPRIIIQEEEELNQTGFARPFPNNP